MMKVLIYEKNEKEAGVFEAFIRKRVKRSEVYKCYNVKDALYISMMVDVDLFIINACPEAENRYDPLGLKFIEYIRKHESTKFTPVIVTSKLYDDYNSVIKELCCNAYIEKPFDLESNEETIDYCIKLAEHVYEKRKYSPGLLFLKDKDAIRVINEKDVFWVEKHTHDFIFHGWHEEIEVDRRAADIVIKKLDKRRFITVGRSDIINIDHVEYIKGSTVTFDRGKLSISIGKGAASKLRFYLDEKKMIH